MAKLDHTPRLIGLFHGGTHQPASTDANSYPVSGPTQNLSPEAATFVKQPREHAAHGRKANRDRHMYRSNRQRAINDTLHVCTLNTQGMRWDQLDHKHRLQQLILACRKYEWDLVHLTELRHTPEAAEELQLVYIEEFLLIQRGRVGFMLPFHTKKLWLNQGSQWHAKSPHHLTICLDILNKSYAFTSVYIPSGHTAIQRSHRATVYLQSLDHYQTVALSKPGIVQLWGGDWNGHVGRDHQVHTDKLTWALKTRTAQSGLEQRRWLSKTSLQCIDQFFKIGHRGTWKHPGNKAWYELDYFCGDSQILKQTQSLRTLTIGISDHRAKQILVHLPNPLSKHSWRKDKAARIREAQNVHEPRIQYELLRGPSKEAQHNRGLFQRTVHSQLHDLFQSQHWPLDTPSTSSSSTRPVEPCNLTIYTDGSCDNHSSHRGPRPPAGWGIAVDKDGSWEDFFGPVIYSKSHPDYMGAYVGTNNVAELCAIGHAMKYLLLHDNRTTPVRLCYDSSYAYHMALGRWQPNRHHKLINTVRNLVTAVSALRPIVWQHVFGHTGVPGNERADLNAKRGAQGERQVWISFRRTRTNWIPRHSPRGSPEPDPPDPCAISWDAFAEILQKAAKTVVGTTKKYQQQTFYTPADEEHIQKLLTEQTKWWHQLHVARGAEEEPQLRASLHKAKTAVREYKQNCRNKWAQVIIQQLQDAIEIHDMGRFHSLLPKLGIHMQGRSQEGREHFSLQQAREHFQQTMADPLPVDQQLIEALPTIPTSDWLGFVPTSIEIKDALSALKESAPGDDQITALMLRLSGELGHRLLINLVKDLWTLPGDQWPPSLHKAVGVLLWKRKGSRTDVKTYRMIVLLSVVSRLIAKIVALRIRQHCEVLKLLPNFQWGFRPHRATTDVLLILRMISELATEVSDPKDPVAIVSFDIQRAYPSVPRVAAYQVFQRCFGLPTSLINVIQNLHNHTSFLIRTRQGDSEPFTAQKGFREGCPSSPCLYNMYHTIPINQLVHDAATTTGPAGLALACGPARPFHKRLRRTPKQWQSADLVEVYHLFILLFADDTTALCRQSQVQTIETLAAKVLKAWGETIHPDKTERILLNQTIPDNFAESLKFLGVVFDCKGGVIHDTKNRLNRANILWKKVYSQLPRLGLGLSVQSKLVQATVLASLLYGCETRPFSQADIRKYQVFQNRMVFGLTRQRKRNMQTDQVTLSDLRQQLGLPTVAALIGRRKLTFLGHIMRKPSDAIERKIIFSWLQPENSLPAHKRGHQLRHQFWKLLEEVRLLTAEPSNTWDTRWIVLATEYEGTTWQKLVRQWFEKQLQADLADRWLVRHQPGGVIDQRTLRAQERAEAIHGALPGSQGKYRCPHCQEEMFLRSLKKHILPCSKLPPDQRAILQQRRLARQQRARQTAAVPPAPPPTAAPHNPIVPKAKPRPNRLRDRLRRRLTGKQPAPGYHMPKRQICAQDLPPPEPPTNWPSTQCHFCLEHFSTSVKCRKHTCSCTQMPYKMWLARVRRTQEAVTVSDHPCPHCKIKFWTAHAKGRHSVVCKQRRDAEHK